MSSSTNQVFTDPWEFQTAIRDSDVDLVITERGEYRTGLVKMELHRLRMQRAELQLAQVTHSAVNRNLDTIYFLTDANQPSISDNGLELPPGMLVLSTPGATHHRRFSGECRWGSMALTPEDLAAAGRTLAERDLVVPDVTQLIQPSPHLMSRLLNLHEAAGRLAATVPDILVHPEVSRAIEQTLVHAMVQCLSEGLGNEFRRARDRFHPVMRRFEQFLRDNLDRSVYLAEVCAAIGVSDRTLRNHCEEHLGMGPHKYLWLRRMHLVRRALALADPRATTVTAIALDHGFGELGRFAVDYRSLFDESPSATLRGAAGIVGGRNESTFL